MPLYSFANHVVAVINKLSGTPRMSGQVLRYLCAAADDYIIIRVQLKMQTSPTSHMGQGFPAYSSMQTNLA